MKRGRISMDFHTQRKGTEPGEFSNVLPNYLGPSLSELPRDIMVNVLLRLSIKRIFVCKLVCRTWYDLISQPEFAKLHFDRAQAYPLIQISGYTVRSRMLYLVQPEEDDFEHKLEMCDHSEYRSKCDCLVNFALDTKFKLPFRNLQMIFDDKDSIRDNRISITMRYHKYRVVNSCNGMLCLSSAYDNDPLVVCNPVTGEFINLPDPEVKKLDLSRNMLCGFGFSPATNQYKVVRMSPRSSLDSKSNDSSIGAKVHTIGTNSWKDVELSTQAVCGLCPTYLNALRPSYFNGLCSADVNGLRPVYFNGFLYWPCVPYRAFPSCLVSFDIQNECFGSVSAPPVKNPKQFRKVSIGVLGGELSISCYFLYGVIEVWVMKDYGTTNMWSKLFSFHSNCDNVWHFGPWKPIKYLNDGALLMFNTNTNCLMYKHPRKRRIRYLKFCDLYAHLEVTSHVPSFVSLQSALSGHNVKVLKPRCTKLKLQNEDKGISVQETNVVTSVSPICEPDIFEIICRP